MANFSKKELAHIRNEIFAAHGHKFKTRYWADYFANKEWYDPLFDNASQFVSAVERKNIKLITTFEQEKE